MLAQGLGGYHRTNGIFYKSYRAAKIRDKYTKHGMPLVMEHIFPKTAGGKDDSENLAASCYRCNEFKGAKTHANDPQTGQLVPLLKIFQ